MLRYNFFKDNFITIIIITKDNFSKKSLLLFHELLYYCY